MHCLCSTAYLPLLCCVRASITDALLSGDERPKNEVTVLCTDQLVNT